MKQKKKANTPIKAIRLHCIECSGHEYAEVRRCVIPDCPLYSYRMGKRPKGGITEPDSCGQVENPEQGGFDLNL